MTSSYIFNSPLGHLKIITQDDALISLKYTHEKTSASPDTFQKSIVKQLQNYLENPHAKFNVKINLMGTPFQKRTWQALQTIPTGKTLTYGELAKQLKTGPRAIGQACRTNPITIIVPCHRIVATDHIGGYAGNIKGEIHDKKIWLLKHEKAI